MLKLTQIRIENYRSLIDTKLAISTNPTVLIGRNGAGKTNILAAIGLLKKGIYSLGYRRARPPRSGVKSLSSSLIEADVSDGDNTYRLFLEIFFDQYDQDDIDVSELHVKKMGGTNEKRHEISSQAFSVIQQFGNDSIPESLKKRYFTPSKDINQFLAKLNEFLFGIRYYSATHFSNPADSPISIEIEDGELPRSYGESNIHRKFLFDIYNSSRSDDKSFQLFINAVGPLGIGLIEDINFQNVTVPNSNIRVKPGGGIEKIDIDRNIVIPTFTIDGLQLSPSQLSEGTLKTLALVYYIVRNNNELLLIEEPEIGVHHGLINSVMELVESKAETKQMIISTHSDNVVDKLEPEQIVLVGKGSNGTSASSLKKKLNSNDHNALREYLLNTGSLGDYWRETGFRSE